MIPLQKLEQISRSLRLRKGAKIFGEAERRFVVLGRLSAGDAEYLGRLITLLVKDGNFSKVAGEALEKAQLFFSGAGAEAGTAGEIRRALNTVYHVLLEETGRCPADWDFVESPGVLDFSKRRTFPGMRVYLEDIRSPFNVGSMFRAAESFGAEKIWLSPLCADPRHKRAERTAMGCVDVLPWERFSSDPFAESKNTEALPFSAGPFFALETGGIPLKDFPFPSRGIMIAGSEELGVNPRSLAAADASLGRVSIPTYGTKGSLNVSVAFGIAMQAWAAALSLVN
jgi:TrmH family RNA methyltransferase